MGGAIEEKAQEVSMQAQLDQLEAAISEAHGILNDVQGVPVPVTESNQPTDPAMSGARSSLNRCQERVMTLNNRLRDVRSAVGQL